MVPTMLITVLTGIGQAVVDRYISNDGAKNLINLAFNTLDNLNTAEANLQQVLDDMREKIEAAKANGETWEPNQSEIDEIWDHIRANTERWEQLGN